MSNLVFFDKQNTTIVWVVCFIVLTIILFLGLNVDKITSDEGNTMPIALIYIHVFLLTAIFLLFYDMKIALNDKCLMVKFGIGAFKKKFNLQDINQSTIEICKPSMWYGIGWRYNLKGDMLFNTRFGTAVRFKLKGSHNSYSIVTPKFEELKNKLNQKLKYI